MFFAFSALLITIIGERYKPGVADVSTDDCLKYELIQELSVRPLKHTNLKMSPIVDKYNEKSIHCMINEIADFRKFPGIYKCDSIQPPTTFSAYKLKPEFDSKYNFFYSRFAREGWGKDGIVPPAAREKKMAALKCCPPQKLPKLTKNFELLTNLLQCDVMLSIMKTVLTRALDLKAKSFSEDQVHRIFHLVGFALQEQELGNYEFLKFTEKAEKWDIYPLLKRVHEISTIGDIYKNLLVWVLKKYRLVAGYIENEELLPQKDKLTKNSNCAQGSSLKTNNETPVANLNNFYDQPYNCAFCKKSQPANASDMVYLAYVRVSTVLCKKEKRGTNETTPLFLSSFLGTSPHANTCYHVMHVSCWKKYFYEVVPNQNRLHNQLYKPVKFDYVKNEYSCPTCNYICNTVVPIVPSLPPTKLNQPDLSFERWLEVMNCVLECKKPTEDVQVYCDEDCGYCKYIDQEESGKRKHFFTFKFTIEKNTAR